MNIAIGINSVQITTEYADNILYEYKDIVSYKHIDNKIIIETAFIHTLSLPFDSVQKFYLQINFKLCESTTNDFSEMKESYKFYDLKRYISDMNEGNAGIYKIEFIIDE